MLPELEGWEGLAPVRAVLFGPLARTARSRQRTNHRRCDRQTDRYPLLLLL